MSDLYDGLDRLPPPDIDADVSPPPRLLNVHDDWDAGLRAAVYADKRKLFPSLMGATFDKALGGGFGTGDVFAVGAAGAGVGKTAFVHQLADGFATRSAEAAEAAAGSGQRARVIPVVFITENKRADLHRRTISRLTDVYGSTIRNLNGDETAGFLAGGESYRERLRTQLEAVGDQFRRTAGRFLWVADKYNRVRGPSDLERIVRDVREDAAREHDVETVVLLIDPIHRILRGDIEETPALGEAADYLVSMAQREELVVGFTSDTTKTAVGGELRTKGGGGGKSLEQEGELAFRGSYQLLHLPDFVFALQVHRNRDALPAPFQWSDRASALRAGPPIRAIMGRDDGIETRADNALLAQVITPKSRWAAVGSRPSFVYEPANFRFTEWVAR